MNKIKLVAMCLLCLVVGYIVVNDIRLNEFFFCILVFPICTIVVLCMHEFTHFFVFKLIGVKVKEVQIGVITFQFVGRKMKICLNDNGFFYGCCSAYKFLGGKKWQIKIALLSGGISGVILAVCSCILYVMFELDYYCKLFVFDMMFIGIYSFVITLLNPNSADRKGIDRIERGM